MDNWADAIHRASYLHRLGMRPEWAKEVRIIGLTEWLSDRFGRQWTLILDELWKARRINQRTTTAFLTLVVAANAVVLMFAALSALQGTLSIGQVVILVQGLFGMAFLADQAGDVLIAYGASRIPVVLELEHTVTAQLPMPSGTASADECPAREIRFEQVCFTYPGRKTPVFDRLDLRIEAGRSLGIVGLNGAGKTTLIKLLAGLEVPQQGRITIDGMDLADVDPDSWRRAVTAIFQDFVHYAMSARDNIGFGAVEMLRTGDADDRILAAARRAGADTLLTRLPHGLDTPLSRSLSGGVDLSGGQWQRLALSRAMVAVQAGARVLILDEPTAQLDVRAEADIYDRFLALTEGLTTIVISHRFSTVRRADRIVVLDGGRIAEDGSHDELVAAGGQYAHLFRTQAIRYIDTTPQPGDHHA